MRFSTFIERGQPRLGVVDANGVVDLNAARPEVPADLRAALAAGVDVIGAVRPRPGRSKRGGSAAEASAGRVRVPASVARR